jgi:transcriptional regulator with XRE-family HTH domain
MATTRTAVRDPKEMGRRIRIVRADMDWTLRELADATGVGHASWSRYENGERMPPVEALNRLCAAIGAELDDLLGSWPSRAWSKPAAKQTAA